MPRQIAVLCAEPDGIYSHFQDVDIWDESRDARGYDLALPVVAHPPCARWSRLAPWVEAMRGIPKHDDGGLFEAVLGHVRRCGGILEHPAGSAAWSRYGLQAPSGDGWQGSLLHPDEWVCQVAQRHYGHTSTKRTWLLAVGCELPRLKYGDGPKPEKGVIYMSGSRKRAATPRRFAEILTRAARSVG